MQSRQAFLTSQKISAHEREVAHWKGGALVGAILAFLFSSLFWIIILLHVTK